MGTVVTMRAASGSNRPQCAGQTLWKSEAVTYIAEQCGLGPFGKAPVGLPGDHEMMGPYKGMPSMSAEAQ